jgi:hypothetical protein
MTSYKYIKNDGVYEFGERKKTENKKMSREKILT